MSRKFEIRNTRRADAMSAFAKFRLSLAVLTTICMTGCAVGPDFRAPAESPQTQYLSTPLVMPALSAEASQESVQRFDPQAELPQAWWTLFHCEALDHLVERALARSPDVAAAQATLRAAQENVMAQRGAYFPTVSASYEPTRQSIAGTLATPLSNNQYIFNLQTAQLNIGYVPDVFGANRRLVEALHAQAQMQAYQLEATRLTLATNVVAAAIAEAATRAQIKAVTEVAQLQQRQLDLAVKALKLGQLNNADIELLKAQMAQTQVARIQLQKQLALGRDQLSVLVGQLPSQALEETFEFDAIHLPEVLPVSLPARLLGQRPDVQAAQEQLHAASAQIGVARANRLPNMSIDATYGAAGATAASLFSSGTAFWSLGVGLTQPIFEGGTLMHREQAARETYRAAEAQYRSVVITAFQNVADALQTIQFDTQALSAADAFATTASRGLAMMQQRQRLGDASGVDVIVAEQAYQQAVQGQVVARSARYADTIALYQALGGGWWHEPIQQ